MISADLKHLRGLSRVHSASVQKARHLSAVPAGVNRILHGQDRHQSVVPKHFPETIGDLLSGQKRPRRIVDKYISLIIRIRTNVFQAVPDGQLPVGPRSGEAPEFLFRIGVF